MRNTSNERQTRRFDAPFDTLDCSVAQLTYRTPVHDGERKRQRGKKGWRKNDENPPDHVGLGIKNGPQRESLSARKGGRAQRERIILIEWPGFAITCSRKKDGCDASVRSQQPNLRVSHYSGVPNRHIRKVSEFFPSFFSTIMKMVRRTWRGSDTNIIFISQCTARLDAREKLQEPRHSKVLYPDNAACASVFGRGSGVAVYSDKYAMDTRPCESGV